MNPHCPPFRDNQSVVIGQWLLLVELRDRVPENWGHLKVGRDAGDIVQVQVQVQVGPAEGLRGWPNETRSSINRSSIN